MPVRERVVRIGLLAADLLFPSTCLGCGADGCGLCGACVAALAADPRPHVTADAPARFPPTWTAGSYEGVLRAALIAFKERGRRDLGRPLGDLLAVATLAAVGTGEGRVRLVPVPSTRVAARRRGGDHVRRLSEAAATVLRAGGWDAAVLPALRLTRRPVDSAGLDRVQRAANLAGAFTATPVSGVDRWSNVVVVDDIVTTGTTVAEAAAALHRAGVAEVAAAAVAGTPRW